MAMNHRILLIGYMGSGKSTVAKILRDKTGFPLVDMDKEIEKAEGMPIRKIFIKYGEHEFRNKEAELLDKLCHVSSAIDIMVGEETGTEKVLNKISKYEHFANIETNLIVSCGGGIILDDLNREILKKQDTVFLEGSTELLFQRVNGDVNRPFAFMDEPDENARFEKFLKLYQQRKPLYHEAAALTIQIGGKSPEEIAEEILSGVNHK